MMFKIMLTMILVKNGRRRRKMSVHDNGEDIDECDDDQNKTTLTKLL